jgi:ABC-type iron transport system FetAB permease component
MKADTSWPMMFYLVLVSYSNQYDQAVPAYVLYVSVVCALLLRFEFLNERLIYFVKIIEVICLVIIGYVLLTILSKFS